MKNISRKFYSGRQITTIILLLVIYWVLFLILHSYLEVAPLPLVILPVVASCWFWGTKRGLLAGAFVILSGIFFVLIFHLHRGSPLLGTLAISMSFLLGSAAGWVRKLYDAEKKNSAIIAEEHSALLKEMEERKAAENRARWDEHFLKVMANSTPTGILAINNKTDEVLYCNKRFCEIWKLEEDKEKILRGEVKNSELIRYCIKQVQDQAAYHEIFAPTLDVNARKVINVNIEFSDRRIIRHFTSQIRDENDEYMGRLFIFEDITDAKRSEDLLRKRFDYEHLVYEISNKFINVIPENVDEAFYSSLQKICEFLKMDLGFFYQADLEEGSAINLYEWRSKRIDKGLSRVTSVDADFWPSFKEKLGSFEKVVVPDIEKLPGGNSSEKEFMLKRGIKSVIISPVIFRNRLIGFLGFSSLSPKKFPEDADAMLKIISDVFANAFIQKKKNEDLSASEERFRLLVQQSADIVTVVDAEGNLKYTSEASGRILGYKPGDRTGLSMHQFVHPDEVPKIKGILKMLTNKTASVVGPQYIRVQHTNGQWVYLESIFTDQMDNPAINGFVINSRDFTQHLEMQEALRDSRNFLNAIINGASDPMFVKDSNHKWVIVNDAFCRLTGYKRENLLGKTDYHLLPEEEAEMFYKKDDLVLEQGEIDNFEFSFTDADNNKHFIVAHESAYQDGSGEKYIIANMRDETRRKELETEINNALIKEKDLSEMKSKFISMVSHEYRTPLTAILSSTELLELFGTDMTFDEKQDHLDKIKNSVDFLIAMLNEVLLINRAESGRMEYNPSQFELINFCRELLKNLMDSSKCEIILNADFTLRNVVMDKGLLRHILINLISNAVKYSSEGGTVRLNIQSNDGHIDFEIKDNGIGIPKEDQAKLFQPFFRANNALNIPGSGLGLSIVKNCVDLHNGRISFESLPGEGAKFLVSLPDECKDEN